MSSTLQFDFPAALLVGLPVSFLVLAVIWWFRLRTAPARQVAILTGLRGVTLLLLVLLLARPVIVQRENRLNSKRNVMLLLDRSESMSLEEGDKTRYQQTVQFTRDHLAPALKSANLPVEAMLFAEDAEPADGSQLPGAIPNGKRTNLAGAIARAMSHAGKPPLAIVALTDGAATDSADNARALSALADANVPFIGVGFGSELGVRTLSLRQIEAPPVAAPNMEFSVSAQLEMMNSDELPPFDLLLFRDGQMMQKKTVQAGKGSRFWLEGFRVVEKQEGTHRYTIQLLPPAAPGLKCVNALASSSVRVTTEKELRVLYVQGALTWDYKFVTLALRDDPSIKLTGLTRTSKASIFRQNVETTGELMNGFPTTLEELAPFRVVVISNLKPSDLSPAQQEILGRYCSELGGGLLVIGGPDTFDHSWQGSRLEQMLPVTFPGQVGVANFDRPFRMQLTDEALQHPVFQLSDSRAAREVWSELPTFTQYGRVDSAKPGAQIWAQHEQEEGPKGRRILMASQRYGAGLSAVITIQNFWRWRLARNSDTQLFDRFWRQMFRYLSDSSRQDVTIQLADQDLRPQTDIHLSLERRPNPKALQEPAAKFVVRVQNEGKTNLLEQSMDLMTGRPVDLSFRAERAGLYTVQVTDALKQIVATRAVEIRDVNLEFQSTGRNMEVLRQWASLTDGLALKLEDCPDASTIAAQIKARVEKARQSPKLRQPFGMNAGVLALILGCLSGEWLLRKRWNLP